ncbi:hypothetical protein SpCBS45565_g04637 [Spizellomyces sp. 'palustris']|nr:hypothetical protein SpCBS45565_g04637 [Spizellomyces sp. 'palustris']
MSSSYLPRPRSSLLPRTSSTPFTVLQPPNQRRSLHRPRQHPPHPHPHPHSAHQAQIPDRDPRAQDRGDIVRPPRPGTSSHPHFRSKTVCTLSCRHCDSVVCSRGMKAILLGDLRVELYSTDTPPSKVQLVDHDYMTRNCRCRIRDVACLGCGNVIGYHVTQPCDTCLDSCNNGHFWMFLSEGVTSTDRMDRTKNLVWAQLPCVEMDEMGMGIGIEYELLCR